MVPPSSRDRGSGWLTSSHSPIAELKPATARLNNISDISEIDDLRNRAIISIGGFVLFIIISLVFLYTYRSRFSSIERLKEVIDWRFSRLIENWGDEELKALAMENAKRWLEQMLQIAGRYSDEKVVRRVVRETALTWLDRYEEEIMKGYISVARYLIKIHGLEKYVKWFKSLLSPIKPVEQHRALYVYWWTGIKKNVAWSLSRLGIIVTYWNEVVVPTWFWELDTSVSRGREVIQIEGDLGKWLRDLECQDEWKSCLITAIGEYVNDHLESALQRVLICLDTALDKVASLLGAFKESGAKDGKKRIDYGRISEELKRMANINVDPHELEKMRKMRNYVAHTPKPDVDFVEANSIFYRSLHIMKGLCKILISKEEKSRVDNESIVDI